MLISVDGWPNTLSGLPSTAGTPASVAVICNEKIYTGHVGDSRILFSYQTKGSNLWEARPMTHSHKPDCPKEAERIKKAGGKIVRCSATSRVV